MKKISLILFVILAVTSVSSAQKKAGEPFLKKFTTTVDIFNDIVMNAPEGIDFRTINQGANLYGLFTYPIKESNFAFAVGAGLGMHNLYSNGMLSDTSGVSFFTPYPDSALDGSSIKYKKNKLSLTYLDFPFELRYKSKGGFKFAIGAKIGVKLNAHTKFKGNNTDDGGSVKIKESDLPDFESWRFGPTLQIGYKWISLTGFYSVTKIFQSNTGPEIYPVSIGISLRPF